MPRIDFFAGSKCSRVVTMTRLSASHGVKMSKMVLFSVIVATVMVRSDAFEGESATSMHTLLQSIPSSDMNSDCFKNLLEMVMRLEDGSDVPYWLWSMLDATGKPASGILRGHLTWPGSFSQCHRVKNSKFRGRYCSATFEKEIDEDYGDVKLSDFVDDYAEDYFEDFNVTTIKIPLNIGFCAPHTCSGEDMSKVLELAKTYIQSFHVTKFDLNTTTLSHVYCHPRPEERHLDKGAIITLVLIGVLIKLSVVATIYGCVTKRKPKATETSQEFPLTDTYYFTEDVERRPSKKLDAIIDCFSLADNFKGLFCTIAKESDLSCLHGLRVLSLLVIIFGQTCIYSLGTINNLFDSTEQLQSFSWHMLRNTDVIVDNFFLISGLLVSYAFLNRAQDTMNHLMNASYWIYFYVHRYLRLTPVYVIIILLHTFVIKHLSSGPFWDYGQPHRELANCAKSWWSHLLYINNFYTEGHYELCLPHTWFSANEMQFYVLSPPFLLLLLFFPLIGIATAALVTICSIFYVFVTSYTYESFSMIDVQDVFNIIPRLEEHFSLIYSKPHSRIGSYLVGILAGYYISNSRRLPEMKGLPNTKTLISAIALLICPIFASYLVKDIRLLSAVSTATIRVTWSIGLSINLYLMITGKGYVNKFLSLPFWLPLSRLTYCAYFVHVLYIQSYYNSFEAGIHFSFWQMGANYVHFLAVTLVLSTLLHIFVERPFCRLERTIVGN